MQHSIEEIIGLLKQKKKESETVDVDVEEWIDSVKKNSQCILIRYSNFYNFLIAKWPIYLLVIL